MQPPTQAHGLPDVVRRMLRDRITNNLVLPMQSHTTARVVSLCQDEDRDVREFTELIQHDPALAGHILAVANSAAYASREAITSLHQAVNWLGVSTLCEIAIAVSLKGKVFDVPGYASRIRELWIHSAATAVFARELARDRCNDPDGMFLCGLLHNVGKPVVMQNLSDLVKKKTTQPVPKGMMELAMDEFHEIVGGLLVEHWAFPEWMVIVVRNHLNYEDAGDYVMDARVINLASELAAWALLEGNTDEDFDLDLPVIGELDLEYDDVRELLKRRGEVLEVADAFL